MQGKTCCVTGHRDIPAERIDHIKTSLEYEVDRAIIIGLSLSLLALFVCPPASDFERNRQSLV